MAQPDSTVFPDDIAPSIVNLTTTGSITNQIFEFRESVIRSLGAYGFLSVYETFVEPSNPSLWDMWISPGYFQNEAIVSANIRTYDGNTWIDITPSVFAYMITQRGLISPYNPNTKIIFTTTGGIAIYVDGDPILEEEP